MSTGDLKINSPEAHTTYIPEYFIFSELSFHIVIVFVYLN
jgi:hypothetical protein